MGYSSPIQRTHGYQPSLTVIYADAGVYTTDQQAWLSIITGEFLENFSANSKLTFSISLKSSGAGAGFLASMRMLFNGVSVWDETEAGAAYVGYSTDVDMTDIETGTLIDVQIKSDSVGVDTTSLSQFMIKGTRTPVLIN